MYSMSDEMTAVKGVRVGIQGDDRNQHTRCMAMRTRVGYKLSRCEVDHLDQVLYMQLVPVLFWMPPVTVVVASLDGGGSGAGVVLGL